MGTHSPRYLPPGTVLRGHWQIGRVLGEGGFGVTYHGRDLRLDREVAVKEYSPYSRTERDFDSGKARFLQEARTMARMEKLPTIVGIQDFFEENGAAYLVMEYVDGVTLRALVEQRGRIPAGELLPMLRPLFDDLGTIHGLGLIHRDISPENLMLENGKIRLLDFGCTRQAGAGEATLTVALKHSYAPAEQYQNKGQGPWTDIYALCGTLYFCLTGRKPPQAVERLVEDELIPPRRLGAELTAEQERALLRGLDPVPRRRFQSAEELRDALYGENGPEAASRQKPSGNRGLILCAAACLCAAGLFVWRPWTQAGPAGLGASSIQAPPDSPQKAVDAVTLSEGSESKLRALLDDPAVKAVSLAPGVTINSFERALEIGKPLIVEEGAELNIIHPVTVTGAGRLYVAGRLENSGVLRTAEGGSVTLAETGSFNSWSLVWTEGEDDLDLRSGEVYFDETQHVTFDISVFDRAVHVTDLPGYRAALDDPKVSAVVIDGDLELDGDCTHAVPVLISPGVTVSAPSDTPWNLNGTVLVNQGALRGQLNQGSWTDTRGRRACLIVNYGAFEGDLFLSGRDEAEGVPLCSGSLINFGDWTLFNGELFGERIYNLGAFSKLSARPGEDCGLTLVQGSLYNGGTLLVEGAGPEGRSRFNPEDGSDIRNAGSLLVGAYGELTNQATLYNYGEVRVTSAQGRLNNCGLILGESPDSVLDLHQGGYSVGVIAHGRSTAEALPPEVFRHGGAAIPFCWFDFAETGQAAYPTTEEELRQALDDREHRLVILHTPLTLEGDLTVTKGLAVSFSGGLAMASGELAVSGEDAFLVCDGLLDLGGGVLTVREWATASVRQVDHCGGLALSRQGTLLVRDSFTPNQGAALGLSGGSYLIFLAHTALDGASVQVAEHGGVLRTLGSAELAGCTVDVGLGGEVLITSSRSRLDENTTVANHGCFELSGPWPQEMAGTLINYPGCDSRSYTG